MHSPSRANFNPAVPLILLIAVLASGCVSRPDASVSADNITANHNTEFMLSFDDGPLPDSTEHVLDMLATLLASDGKPVKAGFFLLAAAPEKFWRRRNYFAPYELWTDKGSMAKYPALTRRIRDEGHAIGNHTTHHPWFHWPWLDTPDMVLAEFSEWEAVSAQVLGATDEQLFRPPYYILTPNVRAAAERRGYQVVMGESAGDATPNMTVKRLMQQTQAILQAWDKPGPCVLVFHDTRAITYLHLDEIVRNLQQQGFQLVHFDATRL